MSHLDRMIRQKMSQVVDSAPMAPPLYAIEQKSADTAGQFAQRYRVVAVAAALALFSGGVIWAFQQSGEDDVVVTATNVPVQFGDAIELDLPNASNVKSPMTVAGDVLIAGHDSAADSSYKLDIVAVATPSSPPASILSETTGGLLVAVEASGDVVLAVVSQHVTSRPPLVFLSTDRGETWSGTELPAPPGVPLSEAAAVDAAIGDDVFVVVGSGGTWVSADGADWQFIEVLDTDFGSPPWSWDQLSEVTWTGIEFLLAGGLVDPTIPEAADHDVAFWRSPDGVNWAGPEVVLTDPAIRTSGGADHIVSDGGGRSVSLTATQQWGANGRPDATDRGTLVTVIDGEGVFHSHLAEWILDDAFAVDGGFVAAAVKEGEPDRPRWLFSTDGRSWDDVGSAPGVSSVGLQWGDHVVISGPAIESGTPHLTWVVPMGVQAASLPTTPNSSPGPESNDVFTTQPVPTTSIMTEHELELSFNDRPIEVVPTPSTTLCPQAEPRGGEVLVFFVCEISLDPPYGSFRRPVPEGEDEVAFAFAQMFAGPSPDEASRGVGDAFPDIAMPSIEHVGGTVIVDFDSRYVAAETLLSHRSAIAALRQTGGQFGDVELRLDGELLSSYDDETESS